MCPPCRSCALRAVRTRWGDAGRTKLTPLGLRGPRRWSTPRALSFGVIQTGDDWATVSGIMRTNGQDRAFSAIFDGKHPLQSGTSPLVVLHLQGLPTVTGTVSGATAMRLQ